MKRNTENVFVIAQKEFTDNLWSPRFQILLVVFSLILFFFSVRAAKNGDNIFEDGFLDVSQITGLFLPIYGIVLGFDTIVKEKNVKSMNILLTHPVYRDNVIAGKIAGGLITLALVIFLSVIASVGTMLIISGVEVQFAELNRILALSVISFVYISTFFALGLLTSIFSRSSANSFICNIAIWINLVLVFGAIVPVAASVITGESILDMENNYNALELSDKLQMLSPVHHYSEVVSGVQGLSVGSINFFTGNTNSGIFDTKYSLSDWFSQYRINIVFLVITPLLVFIFSFIAFLRMDIR